MKTHKRSKAVQAENSKLTHKAHIAMSNTLWNKLNEVAEREGREQGRPKSVSAVMRKALQAAVDAKVAK